MAKYIVYYHYFSSMLNDSGVAYRDRTKHMIIKAKTPRLAFLKFLDIKNVENNNVSFEYLIDVKDVGHIGDYQKRLWLIDLS